MYNKGMRRIGLVFNFIILMLICQVKPVAALDVDNFYFSDFMADYYLSRDEEGLSHLKVIESVTAVFPNYPQNKGICRQISFTNKNKQNITLSRLTKDDIVLTRNGNPEPIYSIEKENDYYNVCTGTEEYIIGEQTFTFEYKFSKVVTEFDTGSRTYQELYWDTNGNGSRQKTDSVTARVHFEDPSVYTGDSWCYVGAYGNNDQSRCSTTLIEDGVEFKAVDLGSYENLTFDLELKPDSFVVPGPDSNYTYVWLTGGVIALAVVFIVIYWRKYLKNRENESYYKGLFDRPEYQPHKDYSLTEAAELYLGDKKDVKVAMLLELIVKHNIQIKKIDKKKWSILVLDLNGVSSEYLNLLAILNDGETPVAGDEIKIVKHTATSKLILLKNSMNKTVLGKLKNDGLVESKYTMGENKAGGPSSIISSSIALIFVVGMIGMYLMSFIADIFDLDSAYGQLLVFESEFYIISLAVIIVTVIICVSFSQTIKRYRGYTKKGLDLAKYMDGLRLYIEMAEAERIKFLQGVETADVTAEGIVRLYEKLLPYAAIFGLEESWMNEMKEYCQVEEIEEPDYLLTGLAISDITRSLNNAASYATTASTMSSSGGGSSSGFSGGGGGGFSGGGGGGGGFSGR